MWALGPEQQRASAFCTECGSSLPPGARFCIACGTPTTGAGVLEVAGRSYVLANPWRRLVGLIIDGLIIGIPTMYIVFAAVAHAFSAPECELDVGACIREDRALSSFWFLLGTNALSLGYRFVWDSLGTSPGRWVMGVKIVTLEGRAPGWWRGAKRAAVAEFASGKALGIGYLWAFGDRQRRTWHDYAAGTWVVRR